MFICLILLVSKWLTWRVCLLQNVCSKFLYWFFSVLIYFNKCVVQLHLRCTQKHICVHFHVKLYHPVDVCWHSRSAVLLWWASPYLWYIHGAWESRVIVVFILRLFFGQGCLDAARLTATLSSSSLALQLFKFGLDFHDNRCPFSSVQISCSLSFHTRTSEVQFGIIHPL